MFAWLSVQVKRLTFTTQWDFVPEPENAITMPLAPSLQQQRIAALNDAFRQSFIGGKVMLTCGINAMSDDDKQAILSKVRNFSTFTPDNDPHQEHDFGNFEHAGMRIFFKLDYYDPSMAYGSKDPSDPAQTIRVLTIMFASEY